MCDCGVFLCFRYHIDTFVSFLIAVKTDPADAVNTARSSFTKINPNGPDLAAITETSAIGRKNNVPVSAPAISTLFRDIRPAVMPPDKEESDRSTVAATGYARSGTSALYITAAISKSSITAVIYPTAAPVRTAFFRSPEPDPL